jgi:hypothetical protein
MSDKINRNSVEYRLAERVVFLQDALETANGILNDEGKFGVLPNMSVSFKKSSSHHKKVRDTIKELY